MSKKFFKFFGFFFVALAGLVGLASCGAKEEFKVEFMIQDANNAWTVVNEEKVVDGAVALPEAPAKTYYTFAGWFGEEALTTKFEGKNIEANAKAYAKYTPNQVKITINGKSEGTKNLIDVVNATYNPGEGLKFNGWYKDSACTVKWDRKEDVSELFANSVALITYDNGYETVIQEVVPGTILGKASEETVKSYMSEYDIEYVDENGTAIDFTKPITTSMNVTVLWNSKGIAKSNLKELPKHKDFYMYRIQGASGLDIKDAPVLSIKNKITFVENDVEETLTIESIKFVFDCLPDTVKKIIIGEGIKSIQGMNGVAASKVENIVLPSTLKIIDNSFNNMPNLKGVTLPEGLEVLIGSFAINSTATNRLHALGEANTNFEIVVPDSVKNIAMMPNNLKFSKTAETAENGDFYKGEDGKIYLKDARGLILVSDPAAVDGKYVVGKIVMPKAGEIVVPEGVVGIQVGTYETCFDKLVLPSTFKFVNYNANIADYETFYDIYHEKVSEGTNVLFDKAQFEQYFTDSKQPTLDNDSNMELSGLEITGFMGGYEHYTGQRVGTGIVVMPMTKEEASTNVQVGFAFNRADNINSRLTTMYNFNDYVQYKDDVNAIFVVLNLTLKDSENNDIQTNAVTKLSNVANISYAAVMEGLINNNPKAKDLLEASRIELYNGDAKVEDNAEVTTGMFLTAKLFKVNKLIINSNWKAGCKLPNPNMPIFHPAANFTNPAAANKFIEGTSNVVLKDITGLTADSLKELTKNAALEGLKGMLANAPVVPADDVLKANLDYFFANATVEFKIDGKTVDPSTITIENGDVTLDVVWTFA